MPYTKRITRPSSHPRPIQDLGRVAVLHFDSHLDSWDSKQLGGGLTKYAETSHGLIFHTLDEEDLLSRHNNMHLQVGSRSMLLISNVILITMETIILLNASCNSIAQTEV